ncbi:Crp/Fnr family transcriptional regulator [Lutimonas sp.]|uniref:Crp/Fnr family transcriptional regulator n=1 Tax=Lutimonas sp. TaxID=1872403 RepID=UPI003D9B38CB
MHRSNVHCDLCPNQHCLIKKSLISDEDKRLAQQKATLNCKKGQQFIMEGTPVSGLFFIQTGKAKVLKTGIYGKEQILRLVKEGETIGHRGFGTKKKYSIGAIALEDSILCNFSNETLDLMLKKIPKLTYELMLFYADELSRSESKVKTIAQMTVREKVIDTLLFIHRKFGLNHKGSINIQLSRKEIADYSGTTVEQVIRVISSLKSEGLLTCVGKTITVSDLDKLKTEISEHNFYLDN